MGRSFKEIQVGAEKKGVREILSIDHPRFEGFFKRLQREMQSTSRIPRHGYFYKDREGSLYFGVDEEKEHEEIIREVLQTMPGIDIEGTLEWFTNLEDFCDCEDCQRVLSLIRPKRRVETVEPEN